MDIKVHRQHLQGVGIRSRITPKIGVLGFEPAARKIKMCPTRLPFVLGVEPYAVKP